MNKLNEEVINNKLSIRELLQLIQTQKSHIDTLDRILIYIKNTLLLSNTSYKVKDFTEMKQINDEIIEALEIILKEELN